MTIMKEFQPFVQSVAEATASAMNIEVEIVDNELFRVAGTGILLEKVGAKQERGYVDKHVLQTSKPYVVENPGHHYLCKKCDINGNCYYTAGIFSPIILDGKAIGLICLISFNQSQRQTILSNAEHFTEFVKKMADLLASKASEVKAMAELELTGKHLETIVNNIREGIIAVNQDGIISYINTSAERILGLTSDNISGKPLQKVFPSSPLVDVLQTGRKCFSKKVLYKFNKNTVSVVSSAYPIKIGEEIVGAVESFSSVYEVQKIAHLTSPQIETSFDDILGNSNILRNIKEKAAKVAAGSSTVLISGESGTGKELFARAIHHESPRSGEPFISINCSAIPDSLLESELFGYEGGAFTGAKQGGKPGKFELANGGTIFLDEIGEMPLYLQSKLLRVLQEKKIERLGGLKTVSIDARVIAATNKDLSKAITDGEFRFDLYYRLNVIPLRLPTLRERMEDLPCLMKFFLEKYNRILDKKFQEFSSDAYNILIKWSWPGNVRELENVIEYACNLESTFQITANSLPEKIQYQQKQQFSLNESYENLAEKLNEYIKEAERQILIEGLKRFGGSVKGKEKLAENMDISRATLYRKLKELGISSY